MVWLLSAESSTPPPKNVDSDEPLARSVHSTRHFKKGGSDGEPTKVRFRAFEPMKDEENPGRWFREVSVDRCQYLAKGEAVQLGNQRAELRRVNFYGWAVVVAQDARESGRDVVPSPPKGQDNMAHADILLPDDTADNGEARNRHLVELAENCYWLDPPSSSKP